MSKNTNTNTHNNRNAWPQDNVPSRNRGESDNVQQHERDLAKIDRMHPPEKGGNGK